MAGRSFRWRSGFTTSGSRNDPALPHPRGPAVTTPPDEPLLRVRGLKVGFETDDGLLTAVDGISFDVPRGSTMGLVGESGCGKSVTAAAIMRLLPQPQGKILGGAVTFAGRDLFAASPEEMQRIRGGEIGMVFQEPLGALDPVQTIGRQLSEVFLIHEAIDKGEALRRSIAMLGKVGIPSPEIRVGEYPHQLSGGMRQRVCIAMALACGPKLLIADEPTTALDVTIQAQILALIKDLQREMGMAVILITHDLGVIAETCDEVIVMYAGRIAEQAPVEKIFAQPRHPYTRGLLASIPRLETLRKSRLNTIEGAVPGLKELPAACRFQNRCPHVQPRCRAGNPPLEESEPGHWVSCFRWQELAAAGTAGPGSAR
jgi:oligopeptide/dipeptide ABC transporter ATP-binding protein